MTKNELLKIINDAAKTGQTELYLFGKGITELPPEIGRLINLTELHLSKNKLTSLPPEIGQLKNLKVLYLTDNQLKELPPEFWQLKNLTELSLWGNQLTSLPPELGQLKNLTELRLDDNKLTELPPEIGRLKNLTELHLHSNQLTSLPSELGELTNLETLFLDNNQLKEFPNQIEFLINLRRFGIDVMHLKDLVNKKEIFPKLEALYLDGQQLVSLPAEIGQLKNLTVLDLHQNQLAELPPELGQLENLTTLWLERNQLREIPPELGQLKNLTELTLDGNPLESPPPDIVKRGTKAVLAYLRGLKKEERQEWLSKMLLVGEGGVGKTSLLRRLLGEEFDPKEKTTHGLRIRSFQQTHPEHTNVTMQLNAWDFGGQYILHATHQFFLTKRSLFILVWNARHGWQQGKLFYWLDVIQARAPESPVLIVATHTEDWPSDLPYEEIQNKYPQVKGRFSVSNERRTGFEELENAIRDEASQLPLMGERWPADWLDVAEAVRKLRESKEYIYPKELNNLMNEKHVNEEDQDILSTRLHDLGDILYFKEIADLSDMVILNPEWVASNISHMLEDAEIKKGLGIFKREHMEAVWPNINPPVRDVFLRLMEQFDLSFRTLEDQDISIVVERLSMNPSESAKGYDELWNAKKGENEITMKFYLNTSLPPGIPTWFIARSHRFTTYNHWRYGALFADGKERKHLGLIRAYDHERYLTLSTRGPAPHNFFALLRDGLELTLDRYPGLNIECKIPCPGHRGTSCTHEFDFGQLEKALIKKKTFIQCPEAIEDVSVAEMLFGLHIGTQDDVVSKIDALIGKRITKAKDDIITELGELKELTQREFLNLFNRDQRLAESHCPNVFAVLPKDEKGWLKPIFGQKMILQLYCQQPGHWHPTVKGGRYELKQPARWLKTIGPYIVKLAKVIKYATPLIGPGVGMLSAEFEDEFKHQLKMMEELAKKLKNYEGITGEDMAEDVGGESRVERAEGAALRALRILLDEVDPSQHWAGLKKILTPEGHYLWLCDHHAAEYKK